MNHFQYRDYADEYNRTAPPKEARSGGFATASLVLGICSIFITCCCCCLLPLNLVTGILAVVFAFVSKKGGAMSGKARWGLILGIIGILLFVLMCAMMLSETSLGICLTDPEAAQAWLEDYQNYINNPQDYPDDYLDGLMDRILES